MKRGVSIPFFFLALLTACTDTHRVGSYSVGRDNKAVAEVEVVRDGNRWTAAYQFNRASPVWVLARSPLAAQSGKSYRSESWTVDTPDVRLERRGRYDVLVAENGQPVPKRVRIRFKPYAGELQAGYDAALTFSDGSVALFDGQFKAFPAASAAEAAAMPFDLDAVAMASLPTRATFRDQRGGVLFEGRRHQVLTLEDRGTYVLFGPAQPIVTGAISAILDPQLPAWLRTFLASSTTQILAEYARDLGPAPVGRPTLMVSWKGATPKMAGMGGSVLPNLVTMSFEGEGVLQENAEMRNQARWFVAHESAHFWLGQAVRYEFSREAWIIEGGADLLAFRTVAATDPAYDARAQLQRSLDECVSLTRGRSVESAQQRNEERTAYACGAIFGLVAEAASGKSFAAWVRPLIEASRRDGILSRREWLAWLEQGSNGRVLRREVEQLLDNGSADPAGAFASLFARAGVPHRLETAKLRLL